MRKKGYNWWILVLPGGGLSLNILGGLLITNRLLPGDISDDKKSVWNDYAVPGLDYTPFDHVRNDSTKISFTVPIINVNKSVGNALDLYAIERTRSHQIDVASTSEAQWKKNPICIYSGWGTHRPPLPVVVEDARFMHKRDFTNKNGASSFTDVTFTMRYIEDSTMFKMWKKLRDVGGAIGAAQNLSRNGYPF